MKRGQFEIMGLAIIMVIISIGIFFVLTFSLEPEPDITRQFQAEQFTQNALTAWLDTTIPGCDQRINGYVARYTVGLPEDGPRCDSAPLMDELVAELETLLQDYPVITRYNLSIRYGVCSDPNEVNGADCTQVYTVGNCDPTRVLVGDRPGREVLPLTPIPGSAEVLLSSCAIA